MSIKILGLSILVNIQTISYAMDSFKEGHSVTDLICQLNCSKSPKKRTPIQIIFTHSLEHTYPSEISCNSCPRHSFEEKKQINFDFPPKGLVTQRRRLIETLLLAQSIPLEHQEFIHFPDEELLKKPIIKQLQLSGTYHLIGNTPPKSLDIRYFLAKAGFSNKSILQDPKTKIKSMDTSKGTFTAFLYYVTLSRSAAKNPKMTQLIIKGITNHHRSNQEAINLNYLRMQPDIIKLHECQNKRVPILALDAQNFWYEDPETHKRIYFTIMKKVPGKNLDYFLHHYWDSQFSELKAIFTKVGRALGELHCRLAQPVPELQVNCKNFDQYLVTAHHDFHARNILYNPKQGRVGFIDLESMAETHLNNVPYWHDIFRFYMKTKYMDNADHDFRKMNELMMEFITGYVQAYSPFIQTALQKDLVNRIQNWSGVYKLVLLNCIPPFKTDYYDPVYFSLWIRKYHYNSGVLDVNYIKTVVSDHFS